MQLQLSSSYQNKDKAVAWTNKIIGNRGLSVSLHNSWLLFFTLSLHVSFGSELTCLVISRQMFLHNSGLICFTLSFIYLLGLRTHVSRWNNLFWLPSRRVFLPTLSPWFHHQIAQQVQSLHTWLPFGSWQDDVRTWFNSLHQKHNEINFAGLEDYHITILFARQLGSYISLYCSS